MVSISAAAAGGSGPAGDCPQHHLDLDLGEIDRLTLDLAGRTWSVEFFRVGSGDAGAEGR